MTFPESHRSVPEALPLELQVIRYAYCANPLALGSVNANPQLNLGGLSKAIPSGSFKLLTRKRTTRIGDATNFDGITKQRLASSKLMAEIVQDSLPPVPASQPARQAVQPCRLRGEAVGVVCDTAAVVEVSINFICSDQSVADLRSPSGSQPPSHCSTHHVHSRVADVWCCSLQRHDIIGFPGVSRSSCR